jgi:inner membrane protein
MDTLTHALSGALVARATAREAAQPGALTLNQRVAAGFLAAAFPDIDFALRLVDTLTYLNLHRGLTHSLVMLPVWTLLLAWLLSRLLPGRPPWRALAEPVALGLAMHIAGDAITAYGTTIFAPLSNLQVEFPLVYVVDPWVTGILVAGLACATVSRTSGRAVAAAFLALLAAYVGFLAVLQQRAVAAGVAHASARGWVQPAVTALPQPFSPFHWKIVIAAGDFYEVADVSLWRRRPREDPGREAWMLRRIAAGYRPVAAALWQRHTRHGETAAEIELAQEVWRQPVMAPFRRFAAYPALDGIAIGPREACVWFVDLRFTLPAAPPSFRYGACREGDGPWELRRLRGAFLID